MSILEFLGAFGLGTAGISAVIVYLSKQVFLYKMKNLEENHKNELNKELKKIEAEFKVLTDRQIEDHKTELKKINDKYHITFSKLHAERAETIKRLYTKLVDLEFVTQNLLSLDEDNISEVINKTIDKKYLKESADDAVEKAVGLYDDFKYNEIYFPDNISSVFDEIINNTLEITDSIYDYYKMDGEDVSKLESFLETEKEIVKRINIRIPELKESLQIEFRKFLGVIEE
ncbi:hypothetical protein EXW51_19195 [Bacillus mycoides]|uniref:hypothetical protein n=1 Tax=Bacillus mycoides TaxID=1405 RepID=UPI001C022CE3|nr:hypothetical protein [Bacillus mycoides]QWH29967.1 hypothetical protein EXW51_19195 [Bacillus mycoides]